MLRLHSASPTLQFVAANLIHTACIFINRYIKLHF